MRGPCKLLAMTAISSMATISTAQDWEIDRWTIDSGGTISSETQDQQWQLSGTLGQWDSTESDQLSGGIWSVSGGFWSVNAPDTDFIFRDDFEN